MNRVLSYFIILIPVSMTFSSCQNEQKAGNFNNNAQYDAGPDWELHWSDEFEGDRIKENNWTRQVVEAGRFNEEWQRYTDSNKNSFVEDGKLVIKAIHESDEHGSDQYTSARLNTAGKFAFRYGKIAARIRLPYGEGIWPAFWMLGSNINENGGDTPWPQSGEIDILEMYGTNSDSVIEANIHYADSSGSHTQMGAVDYELENGKFADDFHIFELEWNKVQMVWRVDGNEYASTEINSDEMSEFHEEFFLLLNIAVGGTWAGRPDESTEFPQMMYVDWVRVFRKAE